MSSFSFLDSTATTTTTTRRRRRRRQDDDDDEGLGRSRGTLGALSGSCSLSGHLQRPCKDHAMTLQRPCKDLVIPCLPSHLETSEGHRKPKGEEATTLIFVRVFIGFALSGLSSSSLGAFLGPSWGSSGESGRSIGAILEAIDENRVWHLLAAPRRGPKSRL